MGNQRPAVTAISRLVHRRFGDVRADRQVPEETPVALSYGGTTHAVMMASPADLEDFAYGFSLTEGIVGGLGEIEAIEVEDAGEGIDIQIRLKDKANTRFQARRRRPPRTLLSPWPGHRRTRPVNHLPIPRSLPM